MISGPKSRNLPKFCTFSRKIALFRKKSHFSALFAPKRKKRARLPGPIKTNAFYRYLSSFSRKGENVRNFAFLRGISGFWRTFAFFSLQNGKNRKSAFLRKKTSPESISSPTFLLLDRPVQILSRFSISVRTWATKVLRSAKNQFFAPFWCKNRKNAF